MTKREELLKQYAGYERKLDELKETEPENEVLEIGGKLGGRRVKVVYTVECDTLEITGYADYDKSMRVVSLLGEEAEKLYRFLEGLYG